MLILLMLGFFNFNSVALSERSLGVAQNPAGLAFSPGLEFSIEGHESDFCLNFMSGPLGFSWKRDSSDAYFISDGIKLSNALYAGIGYRFSENYGNSFYGGLLIRPLDFLSLGGTWKKMNGEDVFRAGVAVKPYKEYLKAYFDVERSHQEDTWYAGISLEPVKGLSIFTTKGESTPYTFGVQISLGNILFSGSASDDENRGGFLISANSHPAFLERKEVVIMKLQGTYDEMRPEGLIIPRKATSFFDLVLKLDSLANDETVKGIFFVLDNPSFSFNQVEELRSIIGRARSNGKKVYFYSENYYIGTYILASSGDRIFMNPSGDIFIPGLASVSMYFKSALENIGVKPEFQRIGEYKSAAEPFIMDTMSSYNREQLTAYLNTVYEYAKEAIPNFDSVLEMALINAEYAMEKHLTDSLIFESDIEDVIKQDFGKQVKIVRAEKRGLPPVSTQWAKPYCKIAYVVADGNIVEGESGDNPLPIVGGRMLGSSSIEKTFEKLEKDRTIKAVVLRVNSPGGSGLASDIMWNAIRKTSKKKPVIVTMGSVAASGGYFISCPATKIVADRTTLTGSIGVLNGKFVTRGLFEKLGINLYSVQIGKYALSFTSYEEMGEGAEAIMDRELKWFYSRFLERIEEGRGLSPDSTDRIGRGRIWSGEDALRIGLIDKNGGIIEAIDLAKEMLKVKDIELVYYPTRKPKLPFKTPNLTTSLMDILDEPAYFELTEPLIVK
ncbi:MAG: signal peptide peptidase SppA [Candidatus Hydrothermia bacterium]